MRHHSDGLPIYGPAPSAEAIAARAKREGWDVTQAVRGLERVHRGATGRTYYVESWARRLADGRVIIYRVRSDGKIVASSFPQAADTFLQEATNDDCRWRTIGGNRVCITPGHTKGGYAGASGKPVYYHGGRPVQAGTADGDTVALLDRLTKPDGGFTYDPKTEGEPTSGYVVATHPDRSKIFTASTLTKEDLVNYVDDNWDLLQQAGEHLGAWHDPKTGKVWLDVSRVVADRAEAERLAREHKQIAFFDLKGGTSIPTPGGHRFLGLSNLTRKIHETGRDLLTHVAAGTVLAIAAGGLHALAAYRDLRGH